MPLLRCGQRTDSAGFRGPEILWRFSQNLLTTLKRLHYNHPMQYQSITQVAKRMGVTRQAVWSAMKRGIIRAERIGHAWVIPDSEVDRLMQPEEIARRAKYRRKEGGNGSDENGGSAYGEGQGLTATSTTNRRGA